MMFTGEVIKGPISVRCESVTYMTKISRWVMGFALLFYEDVKWTE